MPLWLRLAFKECLHHRSFSFFFALNLALGLFGLVAIDTFKTAIQADLSLRSRAILTADLSVSGIRPLNEGEQQQIQQTLKQALPADAQLQQTTERTLYSMVRSSTASRLVDLQAVEDHYPLYGELELQQQGLINGQSAKRLNTAPEVWVYPEVLAQLGLKLGDSLQIGEQSFVVADVVRKDVGTSGIGFRLAPRVYLGQRWLDATDLIQPGSRVSYYQLYRLPADSRVESVAGALREKMADNRDLRIRTHTEASEDLLRSLNNLNDYLGLVALVALFLASIGATYLFRSFLFRRSREIAVLLSLGLSPRAIWALYLAQLLILGAFAALLALFFARLLLPLLPWLLGDFVPPALHLRLNLRLFALAVLLGLGGSLFFCLPLLRYLNNLRPAVLFRENAQPTLRFGWRGLPAYLPALLLYGGLAVWQSRSWWIGSLLTLAFVLAGSLLALGAYGLLKACERLLSGGGLALRLAIRSLARQPVASVSAFIAIGLAVLLLTLIPQLRNGLLAELDYTSTQAPALFLFDIQDDQPEALKSFLQEQQAPLQTLYPMVRMQLTHIKGQKLSRRDPDTQARMTREQRRQASLQDRRHNISSRQALLPSEQLMAGRPFSGPYDWSTEAPAELSLSQDLAEELDVRVGDRLDFDLQGVAVAGEVVNLRKVRWTNFEPNFRILIQPGVIDDAPKTWIGTVAALPDDRKIALQQALVQAFPTLSIIDVSHLIMQVLGILGQIAAILQGMSLVVLLAGFAVLYAIASYQAHERVPEVALLKVLGSPFGLIRRVVLLEFALLSALAASSGALAGLATASAINVWVFDSSPWVWEPLLPLGLVLGCVLLGVVVGLISTARVLATPPQRLLGG